ncbi:hypothetical protein DPEC_G00202620 [Dallia pectoralis]|uniref:Uncharacterized protein n=1 Tax=Dallia pectoralis TaxID=75939 RepID=A0ACC2G969_DALPE|nr:hypothetical protein DPEC_G00202620 [Dallia pectoralis]
MRVVYCTVRYRMVRKSTGWQVCIRPAGKEREKEAVRDAERMMQVAGSQPNNPGERQKAVRVSQWEADGPGQTSRNTSHTQEQTEPPREDEDDQE